MAGIAGSWHCVGMCGGFACALGSDPRGRSATLVRQLSYNLGRVTTYCFIGALVGFLAAGLCASGAGAPPTSAAQRILAIASGLLWSASACSSSAGSGTGTARRCSASGARFLASELRGLLAHAGAGGTSGLRRAQRLPALSPGLRLRRPGRRQRRCSARAARHAGLRPRHLPGHAADGRARRLAAARGRCLAVAAARCRSRRRPDRRPRADHRSRAGSCPSARICTCCDRQRHSARSVQPLPAADPRAGSRAPGPGRGPPVLLLWLLPRLPGRTRRRRGVGGGVAADPAGHRRVPVDERHAVQPAALFGHVRARGRRGAPAGPPPPLGAGDALHADPGRAAVPRGLARGGPAPPDRGEPDLARRRDGLCLLHPGRRRRAPPTSISTPRRCSCCSTRSAAISRPRAGPGRCATSPRCWPWTGSA